MKRGMKSYVSMIHRVSVLGVFFLLITFISCSDDVKEQDVGGMTLFSLSKADINLSTKAQYFSLQVKKTSENVSINIRSDSDWIHLEKDSLPDDGWMLVLVDADKERIEREAQITFEGELEGNIQVEVCKITQGLDNGENSYNDDAIKSMRVGCGYDIFGNYMNDNSVKDAILSNDYLMNVTDSLHLVETSSRSVLDVEMNSSRNIVELATLLTEKQEKKKSGVTGSSRTVKENSSSSYEATDNQYAFIRLYKTCAMRSIDLGVLDQLLGRNDVKVFSEEFSKYRNEIISNPNNYNEIRDMLDKFGTHLVVRGELGAAIELSACFDKYMTGELSMRVEDFTDYFFNGENSSFMLSTGKVENLKTTVKIGVNCHIYGGSEETKAALEADIQKEGRVNQALLSKWFNSSSGDISDSKVAEALVPINFRLIPIWNLFPVSCLKPITDVVNELSERSTNKISDRETGTDYYKLDLTDEMLSFGTSSDATQVKVLYACNNAKGGYIPVLEICNEYVPTIRGDKRIPVIYGIRNGSPFIGAGFFPGDDIGNPPAWITFSEGDCYVKPIDGYGRSKVLRTLYYLNGNIYEKDFGTNCSAPKSMKLIDQYVVLGKQYPIVKIGEGYWTRKNIEENMYFGELKNPTYTYSEVKLKETIIGNILYACVFYPNSWRITKKHGDYYGIDENTIYGKRTKWYLPKVKDIMNLKKYIGNNTKDLLKNQASGFEAQFCGVYGNWNDLDGSPYEAMEIRYRGEYCFIPSKDKSDDISGTALLLSKDYDLSSSTIVRTNLNKYSNEYPVRLYRTAYWKYNDIN